MDAASFSKDNIYGGVSPFNYLTGRFDPSRHSRFISLRSSGIPSDSKRHFLRKETVRALRKMYKDFHKRYPKIKFRVRSSTRNFYSQKYIWEKKWNSKRYNKNVKSALEKAKRILRYSSMPGTSRHHWGTDFDINVLTNEYYNSGNGKIIYQWLKRNGWKYGFCQPYNSGRKSGYMEEKWHWSYYPLARRFLKDWNKLYRKHKNLFLKRNIFKGSSSSGHLAPIYVNSINKDCK